MAKYQILYWRDIPAQVKASDEGGRPVSRQMPDRFQTRIDQLAMREGLIGTDEYLCQWQWSKKHDRPGSAEDVLQWVISELERQFP